MRGKKFVQFSKRVVVAITIAVTVLCTATVVLCWRGAELDQAVEAVKAYIGYATIVFAAYSGNSAVEKWLVSKYGLPATPEPEPEETEEIYEEGDS